MDATQKRRIKKVAIVHFALTVLCAFFALLIPFNLVAVFLFLQPHFLMLGVLNTDPGGGIIDALEFWGCLIAIPLWSLCFGWIYVKLFDRLSHFSPLGKKIF
jgi:succinate-acetate transporter protein